jgi:molybdopterin-guanine dinucleotide biosynthesis protein A
VDKSALVVDGATLLDRVLTALPDAEPVVVVGPEHPTSRPVLFTLEDPPAGGPVAGLVAGLDALDADERPTPGLLAVVAVDMGWLTPATFERLRNAAEGRDGAFLHAPDGWRQLCGVLRTERLRTVRPEDPDGVSVRRLLAPLDLAEVAPSEREADDVDTWADLAPRG